MQEAVTEGENKLIREFQCLKSLNQTRTRSRANALSAGVPRVYYYGAPLNFPHRFVAMQLLGPSLHDLPPISDHQLESIATQLVSRYFPIMANLNACASDYDIIRSAPRRNHSPRRDAR